ncbi:MAG: 4-hydroxy-tetrahydrodipicolinate synthase [Dehalococcoidia bacterium]|nr:4-hydroxy-tetrahydrodipicolinate synthase [Dehalococcoidia bacterium]
MAAFGRLITAMVTPFDAEGQVDYAGANRLALALLDSGSDGVVVSGTTGESPTLTMEEKRRLFLEVKAAVGNRGSVIAGTGSYSTAESIELSAVAELAGVDGLLLVVPYYNKPTQDGLYAHFTAIARSTSLPCILYNVPARTITNLLPETVVKLSQIHNIVGVKEASGNLEQIAAIIENTPDDFLVYSGNDSDTLPVLSIGGYGVISVASHLVGLQIKRMMEKFIGGDFAGAASIHRQLLPLVNAMFVIANPMPVKHSLNFVGFNVGKPRLPLLPPDPRTAAMIEEVVQNYHMDLPLH